MKSNILFIHHSTGANLIHDGNLRQLLKAKDSSVELFDHSYNLYPVPLLSQLLGGITYHTGLSDPVGKMTGYDYNITLSNNSFQEYAEIFSRDLLTDTTLKRIMQYDMVIFKTCYPTSHIESDAKLAEQQKYLIQIKQSLARFPQKRFVVFTQPPLRREMTTPEFAARSHRLADWMVTAFQDSNIKVFNFFDLLADETGENQDMLARKYASVIPIDGHPNKLANQTIAPVLVNYLLQP